MRKSLSIAGGVFALLLILAFSSVGGVIGRVVGNVVGEQTFFSRVPITSEVVTTVANEINKSTPYQLNRDTEMMNVYGFGDVLAYNYRLVNVSVAELDIATFRRAVLADWKPEVMRTACTLAELLDRGVTMRYIYHDKHREYSRGLQRHT